MDSIVSKSNTKEVCVMLSEFVCDDDTMIVIGLSSR